MLSVLNITKSGIVNINLKVFIYELLNLNFTEIRKILDKLGSLEKIPSSK
jgi:hypothetical protein